MTIQLPKKKKYLLNVVIVLCVAGASYFIHLPPYKNNSTAYSTFKKHSYNNKEKYHLNAHVQHTSNAKKHLHIFLPPG